MLITTSVTVKKYRQIKDTKSRVERIGLFPLKSYLFAGRKRPITLCARVKDPVPAGVRSGNRLDPLTRRAPQPPSRPRGGEGDKLVLGFERGRVTGGRVVTWPGGEGGGSRGAIYRVWRRRRQETAEGPAVACGEGTGAARGGNERERHETAFCTYTAATYTYCSVHSYCRQSARDLSPGARLADAVTPETPRAPNESSNDGGNKAFDPPSRRPFRPLAILSFRGKSSTKAAPRAAIPRADYRRRRAILTTTALTRRYAVRRRSVYGVVFASRARPFRPPPSRSNVSYATDAYSIAETYFAYAYRLHDFRSGKNAR